MANDDLARRELGSKIPRMPQEEDGAEKFQENDLALDQAQQEHLVRGLRGEENWIAAAASALAASLIGAALWATISAITEYQIGFMALGVGALVGYAVRVAGRGTTRAFGVLGATLSLFGCLVGNVLTAAVLVGQSAGIRPQLVLTELSPAIIVDITLATSSLIDLLFYAIAAYEGYRFSFRQVTTTEVQQILSAGPNVTSSGGLSTRLALGVLGATMLAANSWMNLEQSPSWEDRLLLGELAGNLGDLPEAEHHLTAANALLEQEVSPPPEASSAVNFYLGALYYATGRFVEAETKLRPVLAELEARSAPPEELLPVVHQLATTIQNQQRYSDAEVFHRRALAIAETLYDPTNVEIARHLNNVASTQVMQERHAEALPLLDRAREILLSNSDGDLEILGYIEINRADSLRRIGDFSEAEAALASVIAQQPAGSYLALAAQLGVAFVMLTRGNESEGEQTYRTALQALESSLGSDSPAVEFFQTEYERVRMLTN